MAQYFGFDAYDVERGAEPFVFISYKNEDSEKVAVYAKYLHDNGVNVWYDNGIHEGVDWESYLMNVIAKPNCAAVLLFVSSNVAKSTVIPLETTQARECKKPTVGIFLEGGLNLAEILSVAIDVYVRQRQSVDAFSDTEKNVCEKILKATKHAMSNKHDDYSVKKPCDELIANANLFRMNYSRSKNSEDVQRAAEYYKEAADKYPSDYRGWLGLAECELMCDIESVDDALGRAGNAAGYYSYVVSLGCDNAASSSYTEIKSRFYRKLFEFIDKEKILCSDSQEVKKLLEKLDGFKNRFGHTYGAIQTEYKDICENLSELYEEIKSEEEKKEHERAEAERIAREEKEKRAMEEAEQKAREEKAKRRKRRKRGFLIAAIVLAAVLAALAYAWFYLF